jgi:hypothetical protein
LLALLKAVLSTTGADGWVWKKRVAGDNWKSWEPNSWSKLTISMSRWESSNPFFDGLSSGMGCRSEVERPSSPNPQSSDSKRVDVS